MGGKGEPDGEADEEVAGEAEEKGGTEGEGGFFLGKRGEGEGEFAGVGGVDAREENKKDEKEGAEEVAEISKSPVAKEAARGDFAIKEGGEH